MDRYSAQMHVIRPWLLVVAVLIAGVPAARATQVIELTVDEMADRCDVAAWGTVTDVTAERMADAPGRFHTVVTITPYELLAADAEQGLTEPVVLSIPGGQVGRFAQLVPGAPTFELGQEVVVMATRQPATRRLKVIGLSLGRYVVDRTDAGASAINPDVIPVTVTATSDRSGLGILRRNPLGGFDDVHDSATDRQPLSTLLDRIRVRLSLRGQR